MCRAAEEAENALVKELPSSRHPAYPIPWAASRRRDVRCGTKLATILSKVGRRKLLHTVGKLLPRVINPEISLDCDLDGYIHRFCHLRRIPLVEIVG